MRHFEYFSNNVIWDFFTFLEKSSLLTVPKCFFFQVHIRISSYQCGGVLLNHHYVATAAHCVHQAKLSQITVHLGEFDTKNTKKVRT